MKYLRKFPNLDGYSSKELELPFPCVSFINNEIIEEVIFEPTPNYIVCEYEITPEDMDANKNGIVVYYGNEGEIDEVAINGEKVEIEKAEIIESAMAYETQTFNGFSYRVPTKENRIFGGEAIKECSLLFTENESITSTGYFYTLTFENDILIDIDSELTNLSDICGIDENGARIIPQSYYEWIVTEPQNRSFAFLYHNEQRDFTNGYEPKDVVSKIYKTTIPLITISYEPLTENKLYEVKFRYEKYENLLDNKFIPDYMVSFDMSETNENYPFILGEDTMSSYVDSRLKYIKLDNIEEMTSYAFDYHPFVEEFVIGKNVLHINTDDGMWPFWNTNVRGQIIVDKRNPNYDSREDCNCIIETATNKLIRGNSNSFIPDTIEELYGGAFAECVDLTHITIPSSVKLMGGYVFDVCPNLTSITCNGACPRLVGDYDTYGLEAVGENGILRVPFYANYSAWMEELSPLGWTLETYVPDDFDDEVIMTSESNPRVMEICYNQGWAANQDVMFKSEASMVEDIGTAFGGKVPHGSSYNLNQGNIDGITSFDEFQYFTSIKEFPCAFRGLSNLTSITLPSSIISISNMAFEDCYNLISIDIPSSVTRIGASAFYKCSGLTSIDIHENITTINDSAFAYCNNISTLYIPDSVTELGINACRPMTNLETISTPLIPMYGFSGNTKLSTVDLRGDKITSIGASNFRNCSLLTAITIPDSVISIGEFAFANCTSLANITIGSGVTTVSTNAFSGCTSLPISNGLQYADTVLVGIQDKTLASYQIKEGTRILAAKFNNLSNVIDITLPDSLESIPEKTFSGCSQLTSIVIPDNVTSISGYVFNGCSRLTSITIGKGLKNIYETTFYGTSYLDTFNIDAENPYFNDGGNHGCVYDVENKCLIRGGNNTIIPLETETIGNYAFDGCNIANDVIIPPSVKEISAYAFRNSTIRNIVLPSNITKLYIDTFSGCRNLTSITLSENITHIYGSVFKNCIDLSSITLPASVVSIGDDNFSGCSQLNSIICESTNAPTITSRSFRGIRREGVLSYPQGSDYSQWMNTSSYYLGYYGWTSQEITV